MIWLKLHPIPPQRTRMNMRYVPALCVSFSELDRWLGVRVNQLLRFNCKKIMTKRDLVVRISEETGLIQQEVQAVVQKTLDYITEALAKGETVELRNFGVFEVKTRKARIGRNPNRPEIDVPIPTRSVVKFKSGKIMYAEVLKLKPKK